MEEQPPRKMDRFGWYQTDHVVSPEEQKLTRIEESKEYEREIKWRAMTKDDQTWINFMNKKRNKVAERIKKGIPDSMRSRAWSLLSNCAKLKAESTISMRELLDPSRPRLDGYITIDKDLSRTFPQIGLFSQPGAIDSLKNVLYAYCQYDQELGYTQGMSFIAGMFLTYMDEESAFYALCNVMTGTRTLQREYFTIGFPRLQLANTMFELLLKKRCNDILTRLDQINIILPIFTTGWFMPAFMSYSWASPFQLRIFERFLFYGTRSLLSFGLTILLIHKKMIMTQGMEDILTILHHPDTSPLMEEWHRVITMWDQNWINKKTYLSLLKAAGAPPEPLD